MKHYLVLTLTFKHLTKEWKGGRGREEPLGRKGKKREAQGTASSSISGFASEGNRRKKGWNRPVLLSLD